MVTVADLLAAWWVDYRPTIAETTAYHRQHTIRVHILPHIGDLHVKRLSVSDFGYLRECSENCQIDIRRVMLPALDWAVAQKICSGNVMRQIKRPKHHPAEIEVFKLADLECLLRYLEGRWLWLPVYIAARTGLRRGEVCGLQWDDIDLDNGFLSVQRTISAVSSKDLYIFPPKTKRSRRRVDLDPELIGVLANRKLSAKSPWVCEAPRRPGGTPNPWHIVGQMRDACKAAGIPHHSFHALRHTYATLLMAKDVHPKVVAERLGDTVDIALGTYSHMIPTIQAAAVSATTNIFAYHPPN